MNYDEAQPKAMSLSDEIAERLIPLSGAEQRDVLKEVKDRLAERWKEQIKEKTFNLEEVNKQFTDLVDPISPMDKNR